MARSAASAIPGRRGVSINEQASNWRIVIGTVDPHPVVWGLPAAEIHERTDIQGGIRTMHELAVAAAATGRRVELRGAVSRPILESLASAAGAYPELPAEPRRPGARDIVVIPEGGEDPLRFARYVLSPARMVLAVLAPTGQFGWPFLSPWKAEPHLTVGLDTLARPEHFAAMAALGVDLWTHMTRIHELALAAGARCEFIGNGDPQPLPPASAKDTPVVFLEASRWRSLAEEVAGRMRTPARMIPPAPRDTIVAELARAKVLLLPARVEGDGRLLREARSVGTVVVGLSSQIYAMGLDEACGAITVDSLDDMAQAVEQLLADPARLLALSEAGRASARTQLDWPRYVDRVNRAITTTEEREEDAGASARAEFGERIGDLLDERIRVIDRVGELDVQLADAAARVALLDGELESARRVLAKLGSEREHLASRLLAADAQAPNGVSELPARALIAELRRRTRRRLERSR